MRYNNLKSKAHCKFFLVFHVVLVTKFRFKVLKPNILLDIVSILPEIASSINVKITEINGSLDHIHFLLETTPQDNLGSIIGSLKCRSTKIIISKYNLPYYGKHSRTLWSSGYFVVSTGGAPLSIIEQYIKNQ